MNPANETAPTGAPRKPSELTRFYLWLIPLFFVLHWIFGARWIACASALGFIVLVFIASTLDEIAERLKERQP